MTDAQQREAARQFFYRWNGKGKEDEDALLPWTGKFNLFDVLKISRTEIRHSNVLSWLFSANENHGLGDAFIKGILQRLVENDTEGRYDVFGVLLMDFYSFTVYREWKNIDILLVSDDEKTMIAIENKVGSGEHSDQLNRYRTILENTYPDYQRILAFLTPDGGFYSIERLSCYYFGIFKKKTWDECYSGYFKFCK